MKSNLRFVAPLAAALLRGNWSANAQPVAELIPLPQQPQLAPLDDANWRAIRVKNAPPSLIAWQLDPKNNAMPAFFNVPYAPPIKYAADYKEPERVKGPFDLPDGVRVAAADEQNLLFVAGADTQQIARLQELVDILDQPLRQVEIKAQLVELPVAELKQSGLGADAATPDAPGVAAPVTGALQLGFERGDFQGRITELVEAGNAKVLSTEPLKITNNTGLAVSLRFGPIDNTGANQNKLPPAPKEGSDTILTLTPTINGDDTITVLMDIATLPATINPSGLTTVANLRDGQTIALTGLQSSAFPRETNAPPLPMLDKIPLMNSTTPSPVPMLSDIPINGKLFRSKKIEDERAVLLLVTARVVRDGDK